MRVMRSVVAVCAVLSVSAWAKRPAPKAPAVGEVLVQQLAAISGDRLNEFAPALGDLKGFPGTAPSHDAAVTEFERVLATRLGVKSVKLDTVRNAMVGDDKNPPVTMLTIRVDDQQAVDALEAFKHVRLSKSSKGKDGVTWEAGRLVYLEGTKTLMWSFSRPALLTPDWDAASLEATRKSIMSIVKDDTVATLTKFVEGVQKRASNRNGWAWDDERVTYSFNVTDSNFIEFSFAKPMEGAALLKDLGLGQVTFENPCDADFVVVRTAKAELVKAGKWEVELTTTPSSEYTGSVRVCTSTGAVTARSSEKLKLTGVRLSLSKK